MGTHEVKAHQGLGCWLAQGGSGSLVTGTGAHGASMEVGTGKCMLIKQQRIQSLGFG